MKRKKRHRGVLCEWSGLQSYVDIGDLRVGNFVHVCVSTEDDRLGLIVALKQDPRPRSAENWTYVLFVWMISRKDLNAENVGCQLAAGKTHMLSNWCQVLPFNYFKALPDCHADLDTRKLEMDFIFDVSRKGPKGMYSIQRLRTQGDCELFTAITCVIMIVFCCLVILLIYL